MKASATKKERMKRRIITIAWRKFNENGFRKTTIEDICRDLAISKKTFYNYFPNKEALVTEIITELIGDYRSDVLESLAYKQSVEKVLEKYFDLVLEGFVKKISPRFVNDLKCFMDDQWERLDSANANVLQVLGEVILLGQKEGRVDNSLDPKEMGRTIHEFVLFSLGGFSTNRMTWAATLNLPTIKRILMHGYLREGKNI